MQMKC